MTTSTAARVTTELHCHHCNEHTGLQVITHTARIYACTSCLRSSVIPRPPVGYRPRP